MKKIRKIARKIVDRLQYRAMPSAEKIGLGGSGWCVLTSSLMNRDAPVLFSGGAGNDISFEREFALRFGGKVFLYDPSPTGKATVAEAVPLPNLIFSPVALAGSTGPLTFERPINEDEGSWTVEGGGSGQTDSFDAVSLAQEIRSRGYEYVDVVKLDIEGFEYDVVEELLESSIKVGQILLEFHDFFPSVSRERSKALRRKLRRHGYRCFYKSHYDFSFYKP